jgi:transposase
VPLPRSNQSEWIGRIGVALQPLTDRLSHLLHQRAVLHADETPVAQLDPGKGKTKKAYLWAYRSGDLEEGPPIVVFEYQPGCSGQFARDYLQDWQGHLMVDDFSGYKALFRAGVTELGCWARARRKLSDLHAANQSPISAQALKWAAALYSIEKEGKDLMSRRANDCGSKKQSRS